MGPQEPRGREPASKQTDGDETKGGTSPMKLALLLFGLPIALLIVVTLLKDLLGR